MREGTGGDMRQDGALPAAREGVVGRLRDAIVSGDMPPGSRMREVDVADRLGVSRTPVREAFLVLAVEGLVTLQPGRGARVREYDAEEVHLVHEIRSLVEGRVARFATDRISNRQVAALGRICDALDALPVGAVRECNRVNVSFHNLLFEVVGSDRLLHIGRHLLEVPLPYKTSYWSDPTQKRGSETAHRAVLEALRVRDPDRAEDAMRAHVAETGRYIARWMSEHAADDTAAGLAAGG